MHAFLGNQIVRIRMEAIIKILQCKLTARKDTQQLKSLI